jgi:nucleotide-binding universal stress UspA family protein
MAGLLGAEVHIYHVVHLEEAVSYCLDLDEGAAVHASAMDVGALLEERTRALSRFVKDNLADCPTQGIASHQHTALGCICDKILTKTAQIDADLIVMSTHGRTGLRHMLIGSITEQVARRSTCSVLSMRPESSSSSYKRRRDGQ